MIKSILILASGLLMSGAAFAQDYGAIVGIHQTTADVDYTGADVSTDGKLGFKAGLIVMFDLVENSRFRTGFVYAQRHFSADVTAAGVKGTFDVNFDYFDIPALYQYSVNDMFALFGGLTVGINVNDDVSVPTVFAGNNVSFDAETLYPLLTLGVNLKFDDQIGFDFYYERGMGKVASDDVNNAKIADFATFGANFMYFF